MIRRFEVGDIVRDRRLDGLLAEWQESQVGLYEVIGVSSWGRDRLPTRVRIGGEWVMEQRVRIRRVGAKTRGAEWVEAFRPSGPAFEVVQTVEERLAEELMK